MGGLFRWEGKRTTHSERLFLITPKLVKDIERLPPAVGAATQPAAPAQPALPAPLASAGRAPAGPQGDLR